jgi:hypothetical protein
MTDADHARSPDGPALHFPGLSRVEPLGSGGMGTVFKAWQDDLGRAVAIKTMRPELCANPDLRTRFMREARILAGLDHRGIVPVHFAGETDAGPYYVMRLVDGRPIDEQLRGRPWREVAAVFAQVADALATAHAQGVLHRDVKPGNVLVEQDGRAVLVDFGLSERVQPGAEGRREPVLAGTPDFLAPELFAGAAASPAADVYALGASLYAVLTGSVPFPQPDLGQKFAAIRAGEPPLPRDLRPDVPQPLQAICLSAMEREPADRYASAAAMAHDLQAFAQGDVVAATPLRTRSMLRRKIEQHLEDLAAWVRQGLLDEAKVASLRLAYERVDAQGRGLLRGAFGSLGNVLLLVGILLSVFGPVVLQLVTWAQQGALTRLVLPGAPLALLLGLGTARWRAQDRHRAVACLFGAALLALPFAFALADLAPALRTVVDDAGKAHPVLPGDLWLPDAHAPAWVHTGARLLEWKLLLAGCPALAAAFACYRRTRAAAFLWLACLEGLLVTLCTARVAGWVQLPSGARYLLALLGALATIATGHRFERGFRRDRAQPFLGLGFGILILWTFAFAADGLPAEWLGAAGDRAAAWSFVVHGLGITTAGVFAHARGTPLLRAMAGAPLLAGFLLAVPGFGGLSVGSALGYELLLVAACIAFLLLGLALHRNLLVLPAAIALPIAVGSVTQRHVEALWAWSLAVVLGGAMLVLLSFRVGRRTAPG